MSPEAMLRAVPCWGGGAGGRSKRQLLILCLVACLLRLGEGGVCSEVMSVRFAVIGDYGLAGEEAMDVADLVQRWNPDFIITTGDNNYFDGAAATIDQNIGQYYHNFIYPYVGSYGMGSAVNRFFPSLGNHDWLRDPCDASPYLDYFTLPGNERYYEFTWGPVQLFALDSFELCEPDGVSSTSTQGQWLRSALEGSTTPWKLVYMHHSPYSSGRHGSASFMQWPYETWGADVVLAAHDHIYERIIRNGFPYFVNGLGGNGRGRLEAPVSGSQVRYNADYGALFVEANATRITFQFISRTGKVIDTYSLDKNAPQNNQAPVVYAGEDQTIFLSDVTFLEGTVNDDGWPDGMLRTTWTQVSGPGLVTFDDAFAEDTLVNFAAVGTYVLRLEADDGTFQVSDEISVIVEFGPEGGTELILGETPWSPFRLGVNSHNSQLSQSFQASGSSLQGVSVALARFGNPTFPVHISVRDALDGADLASTTITPTVSSQNYREPTWLTVTFPTALFTVPGATYYVTLSALSTDAKNFYLWPTDKLNPYPHGHFYRATLPLFTSDALATLQFGAPTQPPPASIPPALVVSPESLLFTTTVGVSAPSPQELTITNAEEGTLSWVAAVTTADDDSWLSVDPAQGSAPSALTVTTDPAGLPEGAYQGTIIVEAEGATNTPQTIPVTLVVGSPPTGGQTVQLSLIGGGDDGREFVHGAVKTSESTLSPGRNFLLAFRFTGVSIPPGAIIESAVLQLYGLGNGGNTITIRYLGEDTGDSAPFNLVQFDLSNRLKTVASVEDTPVAWTQGDFNPSPDLSAIIQEIVDHPDWRSGNSLTLFISDNGSTLNRHIGTFERMPSPTKAPTLKVVYSQ